MLARDLKHRLYSSNCLIVDSIQFSWLPKKEKKKILSMWWSDTYHNGTRLKRETNIRQKLELK